MREHTIFNQITLIVLFIFTCSTHAVDVATNVDLVIFSFDRPLQLYALLESTHQYIKGLGTISVIYRVSNKSYEEAYTEVSKDFSSIQFIKQGNNHAGDFKPLTVHATFNSPGKYILFAVDDIIVKDYVDLSECIRALEETKAYGFYLRMAPHLTQSYPSYNKQRVPSLMHMKQGFFAWKFSEGQYDWGYPHTVDMTLYRKKDIESDLRTMKYSAPNLLEAEWAGRARSIMNRIGLCYKHSKIVNIPLNQVHTCGWNNPHMNYLSANQLLTCFKEGKKIDITPLFRINNQGSHMDYKPTLINRSK